MRVMKPAAETFDALWSRTHEPLCRFVCNQVFYADDAEDIIQEVFISIYHQRGTVQDPRHLES